jgi:hypothetical protein
MVKCMTSENLKEKMVIILAGYESDIDDMLKVNPGLRSRFSDKVLFENIVPDVAASMLVHKLKDMHGLDLDPDAHNALEAFCQRLCDAPNFANGRDVENWAKRVYKQVAQRVAEDGVPESELVGDCAATNADLARALESLLQSKKEVAKEAGKDARDFPPKQEPQALAVAGNYVPATRTETDTATDSAKQTATDTEEAEPAEFTFGQKWDADGGPPEPRPHYGASMDGEYKRMLEALQDVLDSMGLNSEEGVMELVHLNDSSGTLRVCVYAFVRL